MVSQIFQKSGSHLKILRVRCVTKSNFSTEGPQISGDIVRNFLSPASRVEQQAVSLSKPDYFFYNYWGFVKLRMLGHVYRQHFFMGFSIARSWILIASITNVYLIKLEIYFLVL